jgi:hypothetical protein
MLVMGSPLGMAILLWIPVSIWLAWSGSPRKFIIGQLLGWAALIGIALAFAATRYPTDELSSAFAWLSISILWIGIFLASGLLCAFREWKRGPAA